VLAGIEGIRFINFDERDVVRHPLVQSIISAYETLDRERLEGSGAAGAPVVR
jgi:phosphate starvation-inducible protein PhoH and related proteins